MSFQIRFTIMSAKSIMNFYSFLLKCKFWGESFVTFQIVIAMHAINYMSDILV